MNHTIITLTNGKKVANFSSPHSFAFEDGSILPAVSPNDSERLEIKFHEFSVGGKSGDIELRFEITDRVKEEMAYWLGKHLDNEVDVVFVPLPMLTALHEIYGRTTVKKYPFRAVRMEDRIKKLVSIHKQCI